MRSQSIPEVLAIQKSCVYVFVFLAHVIARANLPLTVVIVRLEAGKKDPWIACSVVYLLHGK
jgi:hypothetical protein